VALNDLIEEGALEKHTVKMVTRRMVKEATRHINDNRSVWVDLRGRMD